MYKRQDVFGEEVPCSPETAVYLDGLARLHLSLIHIYVDEKPGSIR